MEWALSVVTAPSEEPITLAEAKADRRVDGNDEDLLISSLIVAAREACEPIARRAFVTQTLKMSFESWPKSGYFRLLRPPLVSVTHVKYYDGDGTMQTMPDTDYIVVGGISRVMLGYGKSWPSATLLPGLPIEITYVAGYGDASTVPQIFKQAMLLLVGNWFENRESVVVGGTSTVLPWTVERLLTIGRGSW